MCPDPAIRQSAVHVTGQVDVDPHLDALVLAAASPYG